MGNSFWVSWKPSPPIIAKGGLHCPWSSDSKISADLRPASATEASGLSTNSPRFLFKTTSCNRSKLLAAIDGRHIRRDFYIDSALVHQRSQSALRSTHSQLTSKEFEAAQAAAGDQFQPSIESQGML